jgi:predicted CopG family antitoxin
MQKKLTISIDERVYKALYRKIGSRRISQFIEGLIRPQLLQKEIEQGYRLMSQDSKREQEALDWTEEMIGDIHNAKR